MEPTDYADLNPIEVEDIVLGQVLYEPECIGRAARMLKVEHLCNPTHRMVYSTALDLWGDGRPVDLVTVYEELKRKGTIDMVGGAYQLSKWTNRVAQTTNLDEHCAIVMDYYSKRILRKAGLDLAESTNVSAETDDLISSITSSVSKASSTDLSQEINGGDRAFSMLNEKKQKPFYLNMDGVDDYCFMLPGNMITISAPSGVGKTAFALSAVLNLIDVRKPWIVSLEMPADELLTRALCQLACVDIAEALQDRLGEAERDRMAQAAIEHGRKLSRLTIDDSGHMTIDQFKAKAEYKVKNEGVELIVVDYAQLMEADQREHRGLAAQNEAISKGLRATCRSLNVIMLVVVHVNREGEAHGSVQYEKDAHIRIKLSREQTDPFLNVDFIKNRNGKTGSCRTPFEGRYGLVGRNVPVFDPRLLISVPHPDNRIERTEIAPF